MDWRPFLGRGSPFGKWEMVSSQVHVAGDCQALGGVAELAVCKCTLCTGVRRTMHTAGAWGRSTSSGTQEFEFEYVQQEKEAERLVVVN